MSIPARAPPMVLEILREWGVSKPQSFKKKNIKLYWILRRGGGGVQAKKNIHGEGEGIF